MNKKRVITLACIAIVLIILAYLPWDIITNKINESIIIRKYINNEFDLNIMEYRLDVVNKEYYFEDYFTANFIIKVNKKNFEAVKQKYVDKYNSFDDYMKKQIDSDISKKDFVWIPNYDSSNGVVLVGDKPLIEAEETDNCDRCAKMFWYGYFYFEEKDGEYYIYCDL